MTVLSRRSLIAGAGALTLHFTLGARAQTVLPGDLKSTPTLDAWIKIDAQSAVTVFTGKAELGQGIRTAFLQIVAEQLDVAPETVTVITADTERTPNEGYTAGSHSMQDSGTALLHASAQVREILKGLAATRLRATVDQLKTENGAVVAGDGRRVAYGTLVTGQALHEDAQPQSALKDPAGHHIMGASFPRVDLPAKMTGGAAYVQDLRLPDMVHARVVRPPSTGAKLVSVDTAAVERLPQVLKVVRDGSFLAVIAGREFEAVRAMKALESTARWNESAVLPDQGHIYEALLALPAKTAPVFERGQASTVGKAVEATYRRPFQMHASVGPSCAVGLYKDDALTIWTHAQGVFPLRAAIAEMVGMDPGKVHCIHTDGSGCYGHNAADDAAADAALLARAMPGRPVRVQWMREQEHGNEPYGPAMIATLKARLDDAGKIVDWEHQVWSNTHSMRPGKAGSLLAAQHLAQPFEIPAPQILPQPEGGGDRNAVPLYAVPNVRVIQSFIPAMPLRVSALRGLGAYTNVFAIESFMDELAKAAGADPVAFRLKHLDDPRATAVIQRAADKFGWNDFSKRPGRGKGFAFARYKNLASYLAVAIEIETLADGGLRPVRAVAAVDCGEVVNPDGVRNQIEGGLLQSMSWTLGEAVQFDRRQVTSRDWNSYPILRFRGVPDSIAVEVIDQPGQPFLGAGEASQGPAAAALANAAADALGTRVRDLPLRPARPLGTPQTTVKT